MRTFHFRPNLKAYTSNNQVSYKTYLSVNSFLTCSRAWIFISEGGVSNRINMWEGMVASAIYCSNVPKVYLCPASICPTISDLLVRNIVFSDQHNMVHIMTMDRKNWPESEIIRHLN